MFEADQNGIYARLEVSPARRWLAYGVQAGLGLLIMAVALTVSPSPLWLLFLLIFAAVMLWQAERMRHATRVTLELTDGMLRDSDGTVLARIDQIERVSRGTFALKPANGFSLIMRDPQPAAWMPGLWWRMGRRLGIGGVTSAGQARFMAERIAMMIRDQS